ncbi:IS3 family transposase [Mucilaginibacter polytrichastri]
MRKQLTASLKKYIHYYNNKRIKKQVK